MLKRTIVLFDARLFGGLVRRLYGKLLYGFRARFLKPRFDFSYTVRYDKNPSGLLAALCDEHGSDKGELSSESNPYSWPSHTYADFYAGLFDHCRFEVKKVFECGIGSTNHAFPSNMGSDGRPGASLRVWRDYFPNAWVVGVDIDPECLFREERAETHCVDQTDPRSIQQMWEQSGEDGFDLMIDDGLHEFRAGTCLFENAIDKLAPGGIYVIEDVRAHALSRYRRYFAGTGYHVEFVDLRARRMALKGNRLIVVRRT